MCSSPKSSRSRSSRSRRTSVELTADQAASFTAIANAADDRRQELKAQRKLLKAQNPDPQPQEAQKTQVKDWRYWMFDVCLVSIIKQKIRGEKFTALINSPAQPRIDSHG